MKTLDELDALYAGAREAHPTERPDFYALMVAAWPEVRERLRRAEREREAALTLRKSMRLGAEPLTLTCRAESLRDFDNAFAALTEEPPR